MSNKDIDQGWAWVVLVAAATSLGICSLSTSCISIFQVEFLQTFQGSTSLISLIGSLFIGFQLFLGPVASSICNAFSIRVGAMFGASVLSLGFILSAMSSSFEELVVYFGIIAGCGSGIMFTSVSVISSHYFHEKRLIACGITFSTPGIGYMAGPTLSRYLIEKFGWRTTLGIHGCLCAQICVLGALFFPIDETITKCLHSICMKSSKHEQYALKDDDDDKTMTFPLTRGIYPTRIKELKSTIHLELSNVVLLHDRQRPSSVVNAASEAYVNTHNESLSNSVPTHSPLGAQADMLSIRQLDYNGGINTSLHSVISHNITDKHQTTKTFVTSNQTINSLSRRSHHGSGSIMWQSHWSMQHVGTYLADEEAREAGENIGENSKTTHLTVLKNKSMWCLSLSQFLLMCGYGIHYIHFASMIVSNGIDISVVPQLYMTQGVCVVFARIIGGLFCSNPDIDILVVYFGCQALLGTVIFCVPFMGSKVWAYHIFQAAFAMYYGGAYVLLSQILVKMLGLRHLATGFGLQMMMAGIAFFITPTFAGWLYDLTGSYNLAYYSAGSVVFLGSFMVLFIQVFEPVSFKNEAHQPEISVEIEEITSNNKE